MSFYIFSSKPRPLLFVWTVLALFGVLATVIWGARFYFARTGDLIAETEAVRIQMEADGLCLYGSMAAENEAAYKLALYAKARPKVVVVGSSRMLQYGSAMFRDDFLNMGRTMNFLAEGPATLRRMDRIGKPDLMIVGIDFWWFNSGYRSRPNQADRLVEVDPGSMGMLKALIESAVRHPSLLKHVGAALRGVSCHLGVAAKSYLNGFGPDGSRYYGERMLRDPESTEDYRFGDTLRRIEKGNRRFQQADDPDRDSLDQFISFVREAEAKGIEVIVMVPPVAPTVFEAMARSGKYGFVDKAIAYLGSHAIDLFDFHDPRSIGLVDCEFLDGFHAGDVASAVILANMARSRPKLSAALHREEIARLLELRGRAAVYFNEAFNRTESDFLGVGCIK